MGNNVEMGEHRPAEEYVVTIAERGDVKDHILATEVAGRYEDNLQSDGSRAACLDAWDYSFKGCVAGFDP